MTVTKKVVVITGASAGIGRAIAERLALEDARLVLAARSVDKLQAITDDLGKRGAEVLFVETDVCRQDDLQNLVDRTIEHYGQIDVLINNAGIECFRFFEQADHDDIVKTIDTNFTSAVLLTRLVVPHMLQQQSGSIINMASTAGKHCPAYGSVYGATKAALVGFTQGLRGEYSKRGIRATAICPGFTKNGGVYDQIVQRTGRTTSFALGGTDTKAVTDAVLKAIQNGPPEMIVNWPPVRPAIVLRELFPRLGEMLANAVSRSFVRRAAEAASKEKSA